jgi:cyclase
MVASAVHVADQRRRVYIAGHEGSADSPEVPQMKIRLVRSFSAALATLFLAALVAFAQAPAAQGGAAAGGRGAAGGGAAAPPTDYEHMTIKTDKLADNFYILTGLNGAGRTGGTIGVLTGPDGIFMVDATFAPLTDKVVAAIRQFSNQPIRFVVNTHAHPDHTGGDENLAKMGATILARPELRAALAGQKTYPVAGLPLITYTAPVTFHMDGDEIVLVPVPPAHTDGDTMIYFRKADVLMIGDFFRKSYPNIGGTANGMIEALGMAAAICGPNTKVVPGHGPVSTRADVIAQQDMLAVVRDRVAAMVDQGKTVDEVVAAHVTADYDSSVLKDVAMYYDPGTVVRYQNSDQFIKQLYAQLKPKT